MILRPTLIHLNFERFSVSKRVEIETPASRLPDKFQTQPSVTLIPQGAA